MRGTSRALPIVVSPSPNRSHEQMRGSSGVPDRLRPVNLGQSSVQPRSHRPSDPWSKSMGAAGGAIQPIEEPRWDFEFAWLYIQSGARQDIAFHLHATTAREIVV